LLADASRPVPVKERHHQAVQVPLRLNDRREFRPRPFGQFTNLFDFSRAETNFPGLSSNFEEQSGKFREETTCREPVLDIKVTPLSLNVSGIHAFALLRRSMVLVVAPLAT